MELLRFRLGLGNDVHALGRSVVDDAVDEGEEREIAALADVSAGAEFRASLAEKDVPRSRDLAVVELDAEPLGVGVAPVSAGTLSFFVRHGGFLI